MTEMAESAKVESIEALKLLKLALIKFATVCKGSMADVESDISRTVMWLDGEQSGYWQQQIRKREMHLNRCREALRQKQLFKDASGSRQSYVDEEKAVRLAEAALQEGHQKLLACKRYSGIIQKESTLYKGKVQRLYNALELDLPNAAAKLEKMVQQLDAYTHLELAQNEVERVALDGEEMNPPASPAAPKEADHGST